MDFASLLERFRTPGRSVMDSGYVSETDSSQPWRGILKTLMSQTVDVPAQVANRSVPGNLLKLLLTGSGAPATVPSEVAGAAQGSGAGYEFGKSLPDAVIAALAMANTAPSAARRAVPNQEGAIRVYHGSPAKFDKFDSSMIGTGEGAQAYGHGGYFAESPEVARTYSTDRSHVGRAMHGAPDNQEWTAARIAKKAVDVYGDDAATYLQNVLKANSQSKNPAQAAENAKVADALSLVKEGKLKPSGALYEASLRWPDPVREARDPLGPQHFLDWDKPMSQQPSPVTDLVRQALKNQGYLRSNDNGPRQLESALKAWKMERGGMADSTMSALLSGNQSLLGKTPEEVAKTLRDAGIPGITYLDAGSRAAGQGTRNYVTFSDDLIELLKRNGMPLR